MAAAWWAVPQPRLLPHHNIVEFVGEGQPCICPPSFELRTTLKDGVKSISSSGGQLKTAAAHVARVRGEEQETRYLARMGKRIGPTQNAQSA